MAAAIKAKVPAGFQQTLGRVHAATVAIGHGDPEPYMRVWSRADDVSVFGAWAPASRAGTNWAGHSAGSLPGSGAVTCAERTSSSTSAVISPTRSAMSEARWWWTGAIRSR